MPPINPKTKNALFRYLIKPKYVETKTNKLSNIRLLLLLQYIKIKPQQKCLQAKNQFLSLILKIRLRLRRVEINLI